MTQPMSSVRGMIHRVLVVDPDPQIQAELPGVLNSSKVEFGGAGNPAADARDENYECTAVADFVSAMVNVEGARIRGTPFTLVFIDATPASVEDVLRVVARMWSQDPEVQVVMMVTTLPTLSDSPAIRLLQLNHRLIYLRKPLQAFEVRQAARVMTEKWNLMQRARVVEKQAAKQTEKQAGTPGECSVPVRKVDASAQTAELEELNHQLAKELSERRKVEEELKAAKEQAENDSQAKSAFLVNMSHEIRAPMNGLMGVTDLLLETKLTELQRDYIETARRAGNSLLSVLNEIMDLAKIEAGRLDYVSTSFRLRELIGEVIRVAGPRAFANGIELVWRVKPDVPDTLSGDAPRLRQILGNLLNNAIRFTSKGEVCLTVGLESMSENGEEASLQFSVRDTGVGIAPEKLESIFNAFSETGSPAISRFGGTGMGLTICRRLLEHLGGRIWAESLPGEGTTFQFTLPVQCTTAAGAPTKNTKLDGCRVLVVDDNASARNLVESLLGEWGAESVLAADANAGRKTFEVAFRNKKPFDIVLLDGQMPGGNGFELAEDIVRFGGDARSILMMCGAVDAAADIQRTRQLGLAGYVLKPIDGVELRRELDAVLANRIRESAAEADGQPKLPSVRPNLRVLVADDVLVNRRLAQARLEKLRCDVTQASSGREAVKLVATLQFDIVLMDVRMPDMDGYEATAAIRAAEKGKGRRLPIIAVTAMATAGDRERCVKAGMDAYLTKPLEASSLEAMLRRYCPSNDGPRNQDIPTDSDEIGSLDVLFDEPAALARFDGNQVILKELIGYYLQDSKGYLDQLCKAYSQQDVKALAAATHKIKGAITYFCGPKLQAEASNLEAACAKEQAATLDEPVLAFVSKVAAFNRALETYNGVNQEE